MNTNNELVLKHIEGINTANINLLYSLMSEDHQFIDAHDNRLISKENMKNAWIEYFSMFPDYKIEVNDIIQKDSLFCILGYAGGTYKGLINSENSNYWRVPAAWTAIVENNQITHWQVYADNIIVMDIINRNNDII